MTFLNASLLLGFLAAAIPIAVHLLSRREPRRVVFPATRFLKQQLESSRARLRLRRWWLLLLRVLAIAALAAMLARPQIETAMSTRWIAVGLLAALGAALLVMATVAAVKRASSLLKYGLAGAGVPALLAALVLTLMSVGRAEETLLGDEAPVALAIVIDNSVRTERLVSDDEAGADGEQQKMIEVMRDHAQWMIRRFPPESRLAVIDRSPRPAAFAIDPAAALRQIERTEPAARTRPLLERVEAAVRLVRTSDLQRRMVMVITDLSEQSFPETTWGEGRLAALLDQEPAIGVQILDCGSPPVGNRRLGIPTLSDPTPPRLTPTAISVPISLEGRPEAEARSVTLELLLYDTDSPQAAGLPVVRDSQTVFPPLRAVDRTAANLAGTTTRVLLSVPPLELGTHHGVVRLTGDDELPIDDERYFTLQVRPASRVLIVASDRDSAGVIGGALTAPLAIDDPLSEYRIAVAELLPASREAYEEFDLIVLVDPAVPSPAAASDLEGYLAGGGKLISLLGPTLAAGTTATRPPEFPAGMVRRWRVPPPGSFLEIDRPAHSSVAAFSDVAGDVPWSAFRIQQYWQLQPTENDTVVMRYAGTDHAALVHRRATAFGDAGGEDTARPAGGPGGASVGEHLILTTPMPALVAPARAWNELFAGADAWPAFLLIRSMAQSLLDGRAGTHNLLIDDLPTIPIGEPSQPSEVVADDDAAQRRRAEAMPVQMFPPRGPAVPLRAADGLVTIGNIDSAGTYWLRGPGWTTGFSVNLLPQQTELARVDPERFSEWLGADNFDLVRQREEIRRLEGRGEPTRPLYSWVLLVVAAALVLEQIIANRFYASSRRPAAPAGPAAWSPRPEDRPAVAGSESPRRPEPAVAVSGSAEVLR